MLNVFDHLTTNSPPRRLCCIFLYSLSCSLENGLVWAYRVCVCAPVHACQNRCGNVCTGRAWRMFASVQAQMCMYTGFARARSSAWMVCVCVYVCMYCNVCILAPLFTLCGTVSGDSDLFLSRLINEEIKVSVSQSRHKDTGRGIRHPAGTSEILISPSLYFPSTARHCG